MAKAQVGDKVRVNFTGTLDDGSVFDTASDCTSTCSDGECSCSGGPLEFIIGSQEVFPAFEEAIIGLAPGESRKVRIPAADAYGEREEEMVVTVDRAELPASISPESGQMLEVTNDMGESFPVTVAEVTTSAVTLDANHPLAGKDLTFDIKLVEIC